MSHWINSPYKPRDWQADALPECIEAVESGENGVVSAIMGAGKSLVIGALVDWYCRSTGFEMGGCLISTSNIQLVDQLYETLTEFLDHRMIGRYYTHAKEWERPIVVACTPSVGPLFERWRSRLGNEVGLWIADECHRTECDSIKDPYDTMEVGSLIGFSATPFRSLETEALSLFETELYDYGPQQAMEDGVIVPPKPIHYQGEAEELDEACVEMIQDTMLHKVDPPYRGLVNAKTIDGSDEFATDLQSAGVSAESIHSEKDEADNERIMGDLKSGDLDCAVHVNKLTEGVDFPWLKWICMRRPISSKVRFCQEIGRALRSYPGKDHAWVLDPHDLFNVFHLNYKTALEGMYDMGEVKEHVVSEEALKDSLEELQEAEELELHFEIDDNGTPVRVLEPVQSWLRQTKLAMECQGLIEPEVESTHWRKDPVSRGQKQYLGHLYQDFTQSIQHYLRKRRRKAIKSAFRCLEKGSLTKGDASDLISVLKVARQQQGWPEEVA